MKQTLRKMAGLSAVLLILCATVLVAQQQQQPGQNQGGRRSRGGPGGPGGPGGGPGGSRMDPARMMEFALDRAKERMGATDQEWTVIKPLLSDVIKIEQRGGGMGRGGGMMMMMGRGPGGPGGPGGQSGQTDPQDQQREQERMQQMRQENPEGAALYETLRNTSAPGAEIQAKLTAYREALKKREAELKAARDKLRAVLTARQEAMLVLSGTLD